VGIRSAKTRESVGVDAATERTLARAEISAASIDREDRRRKPARMPGAVTRRVRRRIQGVSRRRSHGRRLRAVRSCRVGRCLSVSRCVGVGALGRTRWSGAVGRGALIAWSCRDVRCSGLLPLRGGVPVPAVGAAVASLEWMVVAAATVSLGAVDDAVGLTATRELDFAGPAAAPCVTAGRSVMAAGAGAEHCADDEREGDDDDERGTAHGRAVCCWWRS
jgi:hypothetical protein